MCNWQQARVFENFLQDWVSSRSVSPSKSRPQSPPRSLPTYSLWQIYANSDCCCSVAKLCPTLCDPVDCSTPGFPVLHYLLESTQTHVHRVGDAIQPSHPLSSPSPHTFNLSQHQGLFQWVDSLHQVAKILELQLQHQSFQWIFRVDLL